MSERWILAIDLGNGGPKVAAVTIDGAIVATALRAVSVAVGRDGSATQDAAEWMARLREAVRDVIDSTAVDPSQLHAVGITGQWGSTIPVDAQGQPCGPVLLWADTRGSKYVRDIVGGGLLQVDGYNVRKILPWLRLTGGAPSPNGGDPTGHSLLLQREFPEVLARTVALLEPVDYLAFRLTGQIKATPASMILSWLTDNRIGAPVAYSQDLVRRARRDPQLLPPLVPTGSLHGELLPDVAESLGLPVGVPVMTGLPDSHAAAIGSGALEPYATHLVISTTGWISSRVPMKKTDIFHQIASVPGLDAQYPIVINNIDSAGAALQWLREQVIAPPDGLLGGGSGIGAEGAADPLAAPTFDALIDLAATAPPGCEGLLFAPWLNGERSPVEDKHLRATWLNVSLRTDRADLIRSVLEGVAFNARWLLDAYEKFIKRRVPSIRLLGGGAQSDLWAQIVAGVMDRPIERIADARNAQLRGVAMWARVGLGEISVAEAAACVPLDRVFYPGDTDWATYQRLYGEYRRLYPTLKKTYRRLNA